MEKTMRPYRPISPGEILREELDAWGWTQGDFAEITGKPVQAINEIIAGKKAITPETAVVFADALGTSPEFWLNLESAYRLDLLGRQRSRSEAVARKARLYSLAPVKELIKRGWIKSTRNIDELEKEVLGFLGMAHPDTVAAKAANFRVSSGGTIDTPALTAWVRKAEIEASKLSSRSFNMAKFQKLLLALPRASANRETAERVPEALRGVGVRLVFVSHLPQTRVDGAAFWLNKDSPVVALSLRIDRIDNFWFTLMHELGHLLRSQVQLERYLDNDLASAPVTEIERKTNQFARDALIPRDKFDAFVQETKPYFSRNAVVAFAEELGIHPAIVVGRLQYENLIPYTNLRNLLGKASPVFAEYLRS